MMSYVGDLAPKSPRLLRIHHFKYNSHHLKYNSVGDWLSWVAADVCLRA